MTDLDALLAGIVADPANAVRWLVMADWLEENGQPERAELVRVHRELLRTCTATRETKARKQLHARMMELMRAGVQPCLPTRTITLPGGVEMRFSFIPPGSYLMGSPESDDRGADEQQHEVSLTKGFWMGQTPVTQRQWKAVMRTDPSHFKGDDLPVECVTWRDMKAFIAAVAKKPGVDLRLSFESEWEYAARAGTKTEFYWGNALNGTEANCNGNWPRNTRKIRPSLEMTTPVNHYDSISPHPWKLSDLIGNVSELCANAPYPYPNLPVTDPKEPKVGVRRAKRGGYAVCYALFCGTAKRGAVGSPFSGETMGFRLAADLSALAGASAGSH